MSLQQDGTWKGGVWNDRTWRAGVWYENAAFNWQADYWKPRTKEQRKKDDDHQRILLGILPPEERQEADAAINQVVQASMEFSTGRMDAGKTLLAKMEAREAYEEAYRQAYKEAYIAEVVAAHWMADMKRALRRRKAVLLLLH